MKILITGVAGFIGFHTTKKLLKNNHTVIGLDCISDYYNPTLKYDRLKELGVDGPFESPSLDDLKNSNTDENGFKFLHVNLLELEKLEAIFDKWSFDIVLNLAAQPGVRYSLENPFEYIDSNVKGFINILECSRKANIKHLIYASSSSVYGLSDQIPYSVEDNVNYPISLYAATKVSNELMAHVYSHLYNLPTTGLRFFTVYGPWGRPDMAPFLFTDSILNDRPIKVFNYGEMERDFTYVEDVADAITHIVEKGISEEHRAQKYYKLYNVGNTKPIKLMDFIKEIEKNLNKEAIKNMLPLQPGDVLKTWANVDNLVKDYGYKPTTSLTTGIKKYIDWHINYYGDH